MKNWVFPTRTRLEAPPPLGPKELDVYRTSNNFAKGVLLASVLIILYSMLKPVFFPPTAEEKAQHEAQEAARQAEQDRGEAEQKRFCEKVFASDLLHTMKKAQALYDWKIREGFAQIYVTDVWMALPITKKEQLDQALRCYGATFGGYYDYRTGKSVALMSSSGGFRMD